MATILDDIVAVKQAEVARSRAQQPRSVWRELAALGPTPRGFLAALSLPRERMHIIAEVKKASPSAGVIRADFEPRVIAKTYAQHGASCLSVLTDEQFFQGHLDYIQPIREEVAVPLLRKDFLIDPIQIDQARSAGADAVLLIAEILPGNQLKDLYDEARAWGLDVLIEFHDADQCQRVLDTGCQLVGINNRDLRTFETSLQKTFDLLPEIPPEVLIVSESGIRTRADVERLRAAGVRAILVGESLMRSADIGQALVALGPAHPPSRHKPDSQTTPE